MRTPDKERYTHGIKPTLEALDKLKQAVEKANRDHPLPYPFAVTGDTSPYGFLFPQLQVADALLPESPHMREALTALGMSMREPVGGRSADSTIPSAYTYFGQFVDHDITLEAKSDKVMSLKNRNLRPLTPLEIRTKLSNGRKPELDLDSLYYKPAQRNHSNMVLGVVTPPPRKGKPSSAVKDLNRDLPRLGLNPEERRLDRAAQIGDERNDENLIVAQLHVAFLRAHNAIVAQRHTFDEARRILRRHYQWIIIKDFLPRICDPWIVSSIVSAGNRWFRAQPDDLYMPLEFSGAAYRFGHSMVRQLYDVNKHFPRATLADLFELTAFSGTLKGSPTLPEIWVVQWEKFIAGGTNRARPIDTTLTPDLFNLMSFGKPVDPEARLSVRNLLRGYMLRLPTGQAIAKMLKVRCLTAAEIERVASSVGRDQLAAVRAYGFSTRTPLWYYILAEAAAIGFSGRLGPVGSTVVAETLIGLIRGSKDSILRKKHWQPWLGTTPGKFDLSDLLKLAEVLK